MPYKVTFFFEGVQRADRYASSTVGWTETWYSSLVGTLDDMLSHPAVNEYINRRRTFMPSIYRVVWVRASDVGNPRSSKTRAILAGSGWYSGPPVLLDPISGGAGGRPLTPTMHPLIGTAQVTCAVLVDLVILPGVQAPPVVEGAHHRRFLIRGLPTDMIAGNIINTEADSFTRLRAFLNYVGNHELTDARNLAPPFWQIRYAVPVNPANFPITSLVVDAGNARHITVGAAGAPAVGAGVRMQISNVQFPVGVNRVWTTLGGAAAGGPYSLGTSRKPLAGVWDTTGKIKVSVYSYKPADQYMIVGLRDKHTGRPFRLTRGRRRIL